MKPILAVGGGGHASSCADVIESQREYSLSGFVVDNQDDRSYILNYPVLGRDEDLHRLVHRVPYALVAIGQIKNCDTRKRLFNNLKDIGFYLPVVVSSFAHQSSTSLIQEGSILMHFSLVNAGAQLGVNCIVNNHALVEHDVVVGNHCHIATGARVNGSVRIGDGSFIGSGSVLKEGIEIGSNVVIGAGEVVLHDIPSNTLVSSKNDR